MKERYTVNEICEVLRVTSQTVYKWIRIGLLRAEKNSSGRYEIKREEILNFMEKSPYYGQYKRFFLTRSEREEFEKERIENLRNYIGRFCRNR